MSSEGDAAGAIPETPPESSQRHRPRRACAGCGSRELEPRRRFAESLVRCRTCGLVGTRLAPSEEALAEHYADYPAMEEISPITVRRYHELLARLEPRLGGPGAVLDVGCGPGHFLEAARARGWRVHGSEYAEHYLAACREKDIPVTRDLATPGDLEPGSFDLVNLVEVVEHLPDPAGHLRRIAELLCPGGLLWITTPNFDSLSRRVLGADWTVLSYPEHLSYFTAGTLSATAARQGLAADDVRTSGISPGRLRMTLAERRRRRGHAVAADAGQDLDESVRRRMEDSTVLGAVKGATDAMLRVAGAGDSIKGLYVRQAAPDS